MCCLLSTIRTRGPAQATLAGLGIAQGASITRGLISAGSLKVVLADCHHPGTYEMALQYPHRALLAPRVRATVDYLLEAFARDEALHVPLTALRAFTA